MLGTEVPSQAVISLFIPSLWPIFQIHEVLEDFQTTQALIFRAIKHIADIFFFLNLILIKKTNIRTQLRFHPFPAVFLLSHLRMHPGEHKCTSWKAFPSLMCYFSLRLFTLSSNLCYLLYGLFHLAFLLKSKDIFVSFQYLILFLLRTDTINI